MVRRDRQTWKRQRVGSRAGSRRGRVKALDQHEGGPRSASLKAGREEQAGMMTCRTADEFYDEVVGSCAMCADICRPKQMDITVCQVKCKKYYHEIIVPLLVSTTGTLVSHKSVYSTRLNKPLAGASSVGPASSSGGRTVTVLQSSGLDTDSLSVLLYAALAVLVVIIIVTTVVALLLLVWKRKKRFGRTDGGRTMSTGKVNEPFNDPLSCSALLSRTDSKSNVSAGNMLESNNQIIVAMNDLSPRTQQEAHILADRQGSGSLTEMSISLKEVGRSQTNVLTEVPDSSLCTENHV